MWHDGILSPVNISSSSNTAADGQVYTLTQNPGVFASNFIPLWAGLAEGDEAQGAQVVQALKSSGLVGPAGELTNYLYQLKFLRCVAVPVGCIRPDRCCLTSHVILLCNKHTLQ
jgi:hypothetical protein